MFRRLSLSLAICLTYISRNKVLTDINLAAEIVVDLARQAILKPSLINVYNNNSNNKSFTCIKLVAVNSRLQI